MEDIIRLLYECGYLKRLARSGWLQPGIENPESVAEHSFRAAIIAYYLAKEEGLDPFKACTYALFHDVGEARTGDINKVQVKYVEVNSEKAIEEYKKYFPVEIPEEYKTIVRDADLLDMGLQALEYKNLGYDTDGFLESAKKGIKTNTAKKLLELAEKIDPNCWWKYIKRL